MKWEFNESVPIYQQIVMQIQIRIANGTYPPGERISAVRELALEAGVNPNTMQRALGQLEQEGLLYSQRTSGRFVTRDEALLGKLRERLGEDFITEMFEKMRQLGLDDDQILEAVKNRKKRREKQ